MTEDSSLEDSTLLEALIAFAPHAVEIRSLGRTDAVALSDLVDLLESDGTVEEALDALEANGLWVDQNRLVEHGPRGYREVAVGNLNAFRTQLAQLRQRPRTPDQILSDLSDALTGQRDVDALDLVHEIIADVLSSVRLALQGGHLDPDFADDVITEVQDYVGNHYAEM